MVNNKKIYCFFAALSIAISSSAQKTYFSGGYGYSVYICSDKKVQSWGDNYYGQLARTNTSGSLTIPNTIPNVNSIVSIDAGLGDFCCAVTSTGNVLSWGQNLYGELGLDKECPNVCKQDFADTVHGGETGSTYLENVKAVAVGQTHAYALLATGEVVAWGNNNYGQLGDGTDISKTSPVYVKKNANERLSNIKMIAAGVNHGYALTNDGFVYAWGDNSAYQLGCGITDRQLLPKFVIDKNGNKISNVESIDGGYLFGLMLCSNKTVYGIGAYKGTYVDKSGSHYKLLNYAEQISGGETPTYFLENVESISAGFSHSLAIVNENGTKHVVSWGDNKFDDLSHTTGGQLGNGNAKIKQSLYPVYMKTSTNENITNAQRISAGCGISYIETYNPQTQDITFLICGCNDDGQLGLGDNVDRYYPTPLTSVCRPICSNYSLGKDQTLCVPFSYKIETPFSITESDIKWYKNGKLVCDTATSYTIENQGKYDIIITDKSGDCPEIKSSMTINEKQPDFQVINTSFCDSEIPFKVVGEGDFNWYNVQDGYLIGKGNAITASKYFCEEIIADSVYQIWLEHENECQPIPIRSIKKCNCNISAPRISDTIICFNRKTTISYPYDSLVWHTDNELKNPLCLNELTFESGDFGDFTLYATQIKDRCESKATATRFARIFCVPWYHISGTVINEQGYPVVDAKVYLFCDNEIAPVDSCTTNSNGEFSLITHQCIGKILTKSSFYRDTWAGNQHSEQDAYQFDIDANIKHVTITLFPDDTDVKDINPTTTWENSISAVIFDLNGKKIDGFQTEGKQIDILKVYHKPIVVVVTNKFGEKTSFILAR